MSILTDFLKYNLEASEDKARYAVAQRVITCQQSICVLSEYIPPGKWYFLEYDLKERKFQISKRIKDFIATPKQDNA